MTTPRTEQNGRIQRADAQQPPQQRSGLAETLNSERFRDEIARALPRHVEPMRMLRIVMTAIKATPALAATKPETFFGSVLQAAQLGLEPNTPLGHCYLIPYKSACTLQIGYQGMIELSMRSGKVAGITAQVVRKGDHFEFEYGLAPKLSHRPSEAADREKAEITHVYAVGRIRDADPVFEVLSRPQIDARRKRSASGNNGPWVTDFEAMVRKTGVRALWKWLPKSSEMARVEYIEAAADGGRDQRPYLDLGVTEGLERMGIQPILDVPPDVDPETGEVHGDPEPGSMDAP